MHFVLIFPFLNGIINNYYKKNEKEEKIDSKKQEFLRRLEMGSAPRKKQSAIELRLKINCPKKTDNSQSNK